MKRVERKDASLDLMKAKQSKVNQLIFQLLTRKFGPLPSDLKIKLEGSDIATLGNVSEAILDLNSLSELEDLLH